MVGALQEPPVIAAIPAINAVGAEPRHLLQESVST
jgi:hypothetical protein